MDPWTPDIELSDEIARSLIERRFPELGPLELRLIGKGWDNHAYLANEQIVFRIPHRRMGGDLMETECAILGELSQRGLPFAIPCPRYFASPDGSYPYKIAGYPLIPGRTADSVAWLPEARARNAARVGHFLRVLHSVSIPMSNPPGDGIRRADLAYRLPILEKGLTDESAAFKELLVDLATTAPAESSAWVHGDLYVRHLLVDDAQHVTGVIDWGDAHLGDPALDLSIAWSFLPVESHRAFKDAYGQVDEATWRRARFRAMSYSVYLGNYARKSGDENLLRECAFIQRNVLEGE